MREVGRIPVADLPPGTMARIERPPFHVLVVNAGGSFHAIEDACPHSGWSLCEGRLTGHVVTCAGHGWEIDVRDGSVLTEVGRGDSNPTFHCQVQDAWLIVSE